ncbi:hypothetical protein CEXT_459041 [Caerostris extrusa]|uniref:Uncharacterized protein n=1 Tax=Caerostris extrusa TaxID=172846 RepID=A0AAV4Y8D9_CAEEX|nr:hypothetical protein CEXT_459041 [Caerostris extrusa]
MFFSSLQKMEEDPKKHPALSSAPWRAGFEFIRLTASIPHTRRLGGRRIAEHVLFFLAKDGGGPQRKHPAFSLAPRGAVVVVETNQLDVMELLT